MTKLIARDAAGLKVFDCDRALRVAKKLTRILREDLGRPEMKLHMAQASVAAGLGCRGLHEMTSARFPLAWNADLAIDRLIERGFVPDETTAVMAIDLLEDRFTYQPTAGLDVGGNTTLH